MADRPHPFLTELLSSIAAGMSAVMAMGRANLAEAKAAKEAAERGGSGGSGGRGRAFDVLSGLRPGNAKTITQMLAGGGGIGGAAPAIPATPGPSFSAQSEMAFGVYDPGRAMPPPLPQPGTRRIWATGQRPTMSSVSTSMFGGSLPPVRAGGGPPPLPGVAVPSVSAMAGEGIAGAGAGAAGAAGGEAAAGAVVGGAASGGAGLAGAAALAHPVGAAVAAIASLPVVTYGLVKAFKSLDERILENNQNLTRFNGAIGVSYARIERQGLMLSKRTADATAGTLTALGGKYMELREAMQPFNEASGNLKNAMGIGFTSIGIQLTSLLNLLTEPMMNLTVALARWSGLELKDILQPEGGSGVVFAEMLRSLTGGTFKPGAAGAPPPNPYNKRIKEIWKEQTGGNMENWHKDFNSGVPGTGGFLDW